LIIIALVNDILVSLLNSGDYSYNMSDKYPTEYIADLIGFDDIDEFRKCITGEKEPTDKKDVVDQLVKDSHNKCYICENIPSSRGVEHRLPYFGGKDIDRKFDWNNLFLACTHCNTMKNEKIFDEGIIDCCVTDPEEYLDFVLEGDEVKVATIVENSESALTAKLINKVFNYTNDDSGMSPKDSEFLRQELQKTMNVLYDSLLLYLEDVGNERLKESIMEMLDKRARFAGFTRAYIRRNVDSFQVFNCLI